MQFGGGVRLRVRRGDGDGGDGSLMGLLFVSCKGLTGRFVNNCFLGLLCGLEVWDRSTGLVFPVPVFPAESVAMLNCEVDGDSLSSARSRTSTS